MHNPTRLDLITCDHAHRLQSVRDDAGRERFYLWCSECHNLCPALDDPERYSLSLLDVLALVRLGGVLLIPRPTRQGAA